MTVHIHPSVDNGVKQGSGSFTGGTLVCKCADRPVKVAIKAGGGTRGRGASGFAAGGWGGTRFMAAAPASGNSVGSALTMLVTVRGCLLSFRCPRHRSHSNVWWTFRSS